MNNLLKLLQKLNIEEKNREEDPEKERVNYFNDLVILRNINISKE